jgi:hypothetical protein
MARSTEMLPIKFFAVLLLLIFGCIPFQAQDAPKITAVSPSVGKTGSVVAIIGVGFGSTEATSTVTFNGTTATPTVWSATSIKVPVPSGATSGYVVVTVGGQASNGVNFAVKGSAANAPQSLR